VKRILALSLTLLATACSAGGDSLLGGDPPNGPSGPNGPGPGDPGTQLECTQAPQGRSYIGFDGKPLEAQRINENVGVNRARIKPYSAIAGELARALGAVPASFASQQEAFSPAPPRWYEEPQATGVGLAALYGVGFEGGLAVAKSDPKYGVAPDATSAQAECSAFMRKAWQRIPEQAEVAECVTFATTALGKETNPQRKWAYVFATILSTTRFLTY
jgi:hypothetical protein